MSEAARSYDARPSLAQRPACAAEAASALQRPVSIPALSRQGDLSQATGSYVDPSSDDYKAGYAAGYGEGAENLAAAKNQNADLMGAFQSALAEMDGRYREDCGALMGKLFCAIAPALAQQSSLRQIEQVVASRVLEKKQSINVSIHPDLKKALPEGLLENDLICFSENIALGPNAVEIRWAGGAMTNDPDALIADIKDLIGVGSAQQEEQKDG